MLKAFVTSCLFVAALPAWAAATCPADRVIYRQPGNRATTVGFARQRVRTDYSSDLVFWVRSGGQVFWFRFSSPNGYGGTFISPQIDPRKVRAPADDGETADASLPRKPVAAGETAPETPSIPFDAFRSDLSTLPSPPWAKDAPPAYLYLRMLGEAFHYNHNSESLGHQTETVGIDPVMFRIAGCAKAPH